MMNSNTQILHLGLDIGSISINTVLMDDEKNIVENQYNYCHGRPFFVLKQILSDIIAKYGTERICKVAVTGTGGKQAAKLLGGVFVNEIIAQSSSIGALYPKVRTIIEMGGEDSKLIFMEENKEVVSKSQLSDFALNNLCAAGTGSFLDQQAKRIGVSIENEFGALALKSEKPPRIAGRCSVFAKSDMIHLQQIATPLHDIVAGLCFAVARNFKSSLGRGKEFIKPISFQGGVAANAGMVRAFTEILKLNEGELVIPEHHASMGAIGAVFHVLDNKQDAETKFAGTARLDAYLEERKAEISHLEQLKESKAVYNKTVVFDKTADNKTEVYLGLDIGSLSTNVVLIDKDDNVVSRRYLPTASKPLEAIRIGMSEIFNEVGDKVVVKGVGTTGSGRYLTGDFIGADVIRNEITAQATAAIAHDPTVDTIFEIGGQDSKYISIRDGVVVDFEMNKVCAAGTGSFLQEQAEKLDINIIEEFGKLGLESKTPAKLGDRCTVFMESDLNSIQQKGETKENLVAGLAYSIVYNYINRVVGDRPIGNKIFFQGGVTNNKAVVAAFEKVTGKPITVPPHFDVTGAIGAAMLARDEMQKNGKQTRFKGFDVTKVKYKLDKFTCKKCSNQCEIQRVRVEGEKKPLLYGGRCDMYEVEERKGKGKDIPNLFEERVDILLNGYKTPEKQAQGKTTIGIPRALMIFYQQFPFWRTYFEKLGFEVVISDETNRKLVTKSLELMVAETCFPVEVMHGHVNNLLEKKVDYIFIPFIVNAKADDDNPTSNCNCPWVQSYPFMMRSAFPDEKIREKFLIPTLHFRYFGRVLNKELGNFMKEKFGIAKSKNKLAIQEADKAQIAFERKLEQRGAEVLAALPKDKEVFVILGRPYNTGDPELNLNLIEKLINLDVMPVPVDYMPLKQENIYEDYRMMYWPNGQKILAASRIVAKDDRLNALHIGNFRCGPDSFISHFVREEMRGKPYLHLEVDEHSADAGMITRCEAFLDSLKGYKKAQKPQKQVKKQRVKGAGRRTLYFPYMRDTAYAVAAASRSCGMDADVLPMQDAEDLELGRQYTNGQECFPMICTTGSFLKKLRQPDTDPSKVSFFMPDHNGPCRFGLYNKLQRMIFEKAGFPEAEIISPSNDDAYEDLSGGQGNKFRFLAWKGIVAVDLLRKMQQERRPYEVATGQTDKVYKKYLDLAIKSCENDAKNIVDVMEAAAKEFSEIPIKNGYRKPIIAVVGEIFMRDNPFCSAFLVKRLEDLGAETLMAPFGEWIYYSTYRYWRDSIWKRDLKGLFKSKVQEISQNIVARKMNNAVKDVAEMEREVHVNEILERCAPYIHKDYDGDPPLAIGTASLLTETNISGVVHILPFTCMPGTINCTISNDFRKNHKNIPWENIAYDGQEDTSIETRLQAFMHQANEFAKMHGYDKPRKW